jgi:hypothetical protein
MVGEAKCEVEAEQRLAGWLLSSADARQLSRVESRDEPEVAASL